MSLVSGMRRRVDGTYRIDEWGLDRDLVELVSPAVGMRWSVSSTGQERLPAEGPGLLVHNQRIGVSEPFVLMRGVRLATGRTVRVVGAPDVAPIGPAVRRFGAVLDHPLEVAGLLDAGELVGLPLGREPRHRHKAGPLPATVLGPAIAVGAPVIPVALIGSELGRTWRVAVGEPLGPSGPGPLAAAELAESARRAVQELLDEAIPPRWPFG